ncbi:hypothetical protein RJ639_012425 [Escallonia herrerae]|uniref:Uncharacterized protein n=1 Tax=Escallonia herrerae TaxID=1293975 RepID=A0AA88VJ26_9ASTE|nr:hypothetical protein RJ639_012425 [Escallonia herrerae]
MAGQITWDFRLVTGPFSYLLKGRITTDLAAQPFPFSPLGQILRVANNLESIPMEQNHPSYFGKVGLSYFHHFRNKFHCPVVNVEHIWSLVSQEAREKVAGSSAAPVVDVMHRKGVF